MNILVTGSEGFIGQHLTKALTKLDHQVVGYDLVLGEDIRFMPLDFIPKDIECVIHLAAQISVGQSLSQLYYYTDHNVMGIASLLSFLVSSDHNVQHVILASSRAVYGEGPYYCSNCATTVYPEARTLQQLQTKAWDILCPNCNSCMNPLDIYVSDNLDPISIYGQNKLAQEGLLKVVANAYELDYTILRLFNVYGPGQDMDNRFTGIASILMGKALTNKIMPIYEDGKMTKDFVYIDDIINVFIQHINSPGGVHNVGTGFEYSLHEVAEKIKTIANSKSDIIITEQFRVGDPRHSRSFGHPTCHTPLMSGLQSLYEWATCQK